MLRPLAPEARAALVKGGSGFPSLGRNFVILRTVGDASTRRGGVALTVISLACLVAGTASAAASLLSVRRRVILELTGGVLFVAGLCIIGARTPLFR
jgi:hypothetical protein